MILIYYNLFFFFSFEGKKIRDAFHLSMLLVPLPVIYQFASREEGGSWRILPH